MISNSIVYQRQYDHDLLDDQEKSLFVRVSKSVLPILSFYTPLRVPLSVGLGFLRIFTHVEELIFSIKNKKIYESLVKGGQIFLSLIATTLVVASLFTYYFNPSATFLATGFDDFISNVRELFEAIGRGEMSQIGEVMMHMATTILFTSFITFGHIEILAAVMLVQILHNLIKGIANCSKDRYLEGVGHFLFSLLTLLQLTPQLRVIKWKWSHKPVLEGELCQDRRGFVYVKVKDEILYELNKACKAGNIPPYFKKGMYGAHITVIPVGELGTDIKIADLGKMIKFNIASYDSIKPHAWKGVNKVSFLTLSAPSLDTIRSKYGLTSKVHGTHDFHLTIGVL